MNYAPIVIFGYNRPDHIEKTIRALEQNYNASECDVFVCLDGKKENDTSSKVEDTYKIVKSIVNDNKFKSFTIIKREENKGLGYSIINGVTDIINRFGRIIVLEDDLITTPDFIQYMNRALDFYEDEKPIWSIAGYSQDLDAMKNRSEDVFFSYRASSWSWATWKNRWDETDWEVKDYSSYRYNLVKRHRFNRGGTNMAIMLDMQMAGKIDSWAIRWCYSQSKRNMLTVYPKRSKIINIGIDGSGTHGGSVADDDHKESHQQESGSGFCHVYIDKAIIKEFRRKNSLSMRSRVSRFIKLNILHI